MFFFFFTWPVLSQIEILELMPSATFSVCVDLREENSAGSQMKSRGKKRKKK